MMMMHHRSPSGTVEFERDAAMPLQRRIHLSMDELLGIRLSHRTGYGVENSPHTAPEAAMVALL